ncbi:hypothetical protein JOC70_000083 [Clostridium pascui]|nr:hypothetical protein [Clostridium pascui]
MTLQKPNKNTSYYLKVNNLQEAVMIGLSKYNRETCEVFYIKKWRNDYLVFFKYRNNLLLGNVTKDKNRWHWAQIGEGYNMSNDDEVDANLRGSSILTLSGEVLKLVVIIVFNPKEFVNVWSSYLEFEIIKIGGEEIHLSITDLNKHIEI